MIYFPHPSEASEEGVLAIGGDLSLDRLLLAYQWGIFPWYSPKDPIIWWHPDPRFVIYPQNLKVSKSMRPYFNQTKFTVSYDSCFEKVIEYCANTKRKGQDDTWISEEMKLAYTELHYAGYCHSVEVWDGTNLVGGLYGVSLGNIFFGESMFSLVSNASKFALISLTKKLMPLGLKLIDCQQANDHLKSLGGTFISRNVFLDQLRGNTHAADLKGDWNKILC